MYREGFRKKCVTLGIYICKAERYQIGNINFYTYKNTLKEESKIKVRKRSIHVRDVNIKVENNIHIKKNDY